MIRLIGSELLKIRTAPRTLLGLVLAELAIVAIGTASTIDSATESPPGLEIGTPPTLESDLISVAASSLLLALILGILVVTWEYRHGTITQTFLATPVRERVLGAKALVAALAGAALTVPALLLMFVIAEIWVGDELHFGSSEWRQILQLALAAALVGILGVEIGAGTRRQLAAIVVAFVWLSFVEHALTVFTSLDAYLPGHAVSGVLGTGGEDAPSFEKGLLVLVAYIAALGALGATVTRRRDIT